MMAHIYIFVDLKIGHMPIHMWHIIFISHQHFQFHSLLYVVCLGSSVSSAKAIASTVCLTKFVLQRHLQLFWVHLIERVEVEQQQTL